MQPLSYFQQLSTALFTEMKAAADGQKTSLAFVKNPISAGAIVPNRTPFQVIIIGGSHLRSCLVERRIEGLVILESYKEPVPVFSSKQILMEVLTKIIRPDVTAVGLNFAYPMQVISRNSILDGRLISGTKEHSFEGLIGEVVGAEIEAEIFSSRQQKITVSVCNDTVSLGLAGLDEYSSNSSKPRIAAGVVGTGFNFGLFISPTEFVNLESGNFANFKQTQSAIEIDKNSKNPGKQLFEKEVGGKYLWQHFNILAQKEGLSFRLNDSSQLSSLAENDVTILGQIATQILQHAASMVAAKIAAVNEFSKVSLASKNPLMVVVEGSVYWEAYGFKSTVESVLAQLTSDTINVTHVQNSGVTGTARLLG